MRDMRRRRANEILQPSASPLLRNRSPREDDVRLHPGRGRPGARAPQRESTPEAFLETIAPYRDDLVVAVECMFTWYWLADLCAAEGIAFVLGHALAMKAIHGGKAQE